MKKILSELRPIAGDVARGAVARHVAPSGLNALLVIELVFGGAFVLSCEVPNWLFGPRQANACVERWWGAGALLFPSGVKDVMGGGGPGGGGLGGSSERPEAPAKPLWPRQRDEHGRFLPIEEE